MKISLRILLGALLFLPLLITSEEEAVSFNMHWENLGGDAKSSPSIASWGNNRLDVFIRAQDNTMHWKFWNGASWSNWTSLGGALTSAPDCTAPASSLIYCSVRGPDNGMWIKRGVLTGNGMLWDDWDPQGGALGSGPSIAHANFSDGHIELQAFVRGPGETLWSKRFNGQIWGNWFEIPDSVFEGDPDCTWSGSGEFDCALRSTNDTLMVNTGCCLTNQGTQWADIGGTLNTSATITSWGGDNFNVLTRGPGSSLWWTQTNGFIWDVWEELDPTVTMTTAPDCVSISLGAIHCVLNN
jgi:hypothetical protein